MRARLTGVIFPRAAVVQGQVFRSISNECAKKKKQKNMNGQCVLGCYFKLLPIINFL